VALPLSGARPFRVEDPQSGASIAVKLVGARAVAASVVPGEVRYRAALGTASQGADWVLRATRQGLEDFVLLRRAPVRETVTYEVTLGGSISGLRLVENTLEFLVADAPRLRMTAPTLGDRKGRIFPAQVSVQGCAVDTDSRVPFGRAPVNPGARTCRVHVSWAGRGVVYPAVLDPAWTYTGTMACRRYFHTSTELCSGRALVVGGLGAPKCAEIYDRPSRAWTRVADTNAPHDRFHTATLLPSGCPNSSCEVLVTGGGFAPVDKVETYDEASGVWTSREEMEFPREEHTATPVYDGCSVLIAGGRTATNVYRRETEVFSGATHTWTASGPMLHRRFSHIASILRCGAVLAANGQGEEAASDSSELWDPATGQWTATQGQPSVQRWLHSSCALHDGRVVVMGGQANGVFHRTAEIYDPLTDLWTPTASMSVGRSRFTCTTLGDGTAMVVGGVTPTGPNGTVVANATTEILDPDANGNLGIWTLGPQLNEGRYAHAATYLDGSRCNRPDNELLVSAGYDGSTAKNTAETVVVP
jgi:hypothetical protein